MIHNIELISNNLYKIRNVYWSIRELVEDQGGNLPYSFISELGVINTELEDFLTTIGAPLDGDRYEEDK